MHLARAARAAVEVVLEVRVAAGGSGRLRERGRRERCAPEIRVHDHPCCVENATEPWRPRRLELGVQSRSEVAGVPAGTNVFARAREDPAGGVDCKRILDAAGEFVHGGEVPQAHHCASAFAGSAGISAQRRS